MVTFSIMLYRQIQNSFYRLPVKRMTMPKFMQSVSKQTYEKLIAIARNKGIKLQELIRVIIIPEWLEEREKKG